MSTIHICVENMCQILEYLFFKDCDNSFVHFCSDIYLLKVTLLGNKVCEASVACVVNFLMADVCIYKEEYV